MNAVATIERLPPGAAWKLLLRLEARLLTFRRKAAGLPEAQRARVDADARRLWPLAMAAMARDERERTI